jgi:hypothetical protein
MGNGVKMAMSDRPLASLGILSSAVYGYRRNASRLTWMRYSAIKDGTIIVRFVIAFNGTDTQVREVGDELWMPTRGTLERSTSPLYTTYAWLRYATQTAPHNLAGALIKCDDDAFIVIPELVLQLRLMPFVQDPEAMTYFGRFFWTAYDAAQYTHIASTFSPSEASYHRWSMECAPARRRNCTGPFPFATGSLQGLSQALARSLASSELAIEHVRAVRLANLAHRKTPVYEDAWMGFALVGLLPPNASRTIVAIGMPVNSFFDSYGFEMNNFSMVVHWKGGKWASLLLARMRAARAYVHMHRCESNTSLRCGEICHATGWAASYPRGCRAGHCSPGRPWMWCALHVGNDTCANVHREKISLAETWRLGGAEPVGFR